MKFIYGPLHMDAQVLADHKNLLITALSGHRILFGGPTQKAMDEREGLRDDRYKLLRLKGIQRRVTKLIKDYS